VAEAVVGAAVGAVWDSYLGCCSDLAAEGIAAEAGLAEADLVVAADLAEVASVVSAAGAQAAAGRSVVIRKREACDGSGKTD